MAAASGRLQAAAARRAVLPAGLALRRSRALS